MHAQANNGHQKLSTIDTSLVNNVEERCQCGFSLTNVMSPNFRCFGESEDAATYRAEINGTLLASSDHIVLFIEEWLSQGALILFDIILVPLDGSCQVVVTSLADPECNTPTSMTTVPMTEATSSLPTDQPVSLAAIVGGAIGGVIIVLVGAVIIIISIVSIRAKRTQVFNVNSNRYISILIVLCTHLN